MLKILKLLLFLSICYAGISKKTTYNSPNQVQVEFKVNALTDADLSAISVLFGLPSNKRPRVSITYNQKAPLPFYSSKLSNEQIEEIPIQKLQGLYVLPLKIFPKINQTEYYQNIIIQITFDNNIELFSEPTKNQNDFLKNRILNWEQSKNWIQGRIRSVRKFSTLDDGSWFQFFIEEDGVYSIENSILRDIDPSLISKDPRSFSLFMSNELGRSRTHSTNQAIPANLREISILVSGEEDGSFDLNDKIIFYGRGPSGFDFNGETLEWNQNIYFNKNSCWLFVPNDDQKRGKRITTYSQPEEGTLINYGFSTIHFESDIINLAASGTEWLSNPISSGNSQAIIADLPSPVQGASFNFQTRLRGHSSSISSSAFHSITLHAGSINNEAIGGSLNWSGNASRTLVENSNSLILEDGINFFYLKNISSDNNSKPYIDFSEIKYARNLKINNPFSFTTPIENQNVRFSFSGEPNENFFLWDITNPENSKNIKINPDGFCNVSSSSNEMSYFISFNMLTTKNITEIVRKEDHNFIKLRNQNLSADYVIIGPEEYRNLTVDLLELRKPAVFASIENIYDEFSAGNKDPISIRTFIQWTQEEWNSPQPNCVLFLGDGGYDYRNISGQSSIIIPTIQVQSYRPYATDDLLSTIYGNLPEVASGRFPAKNQQDVIKFVEKIIDIEMNPNFGIWRQKVTLVADDAARPEPSHGSIATGKSHTINSEQLADLIPSPIYTEKIYMMDYPEVGDASAYGVVKPEATEELIESINRGTAIISYIGHGSPTQLAQEKLLALDRGDMNKINNSGKLPLWIVGTCSFGHFDDPLTESFAEALIKDPMNSASAVISTTRPISVVGNERYTYDLFQNIFSDNQISNSKIGFILQSIKDGSDESQYFHLFGDPGLKIPMPKELISNLSISEDTLETLKIGSFTGSQSLITNIGVGFVSLYDAEKQITREYQILSETYSLSYKKSGSTLFRGRFSFEDHSFNGQFRIPKDISYSENPSKLIVYLHDEENEMIGSFDNLYLIGGVDSVDFFGPTITLETLEGIRLEDGDHFSKNKPISIRISDPLGINLTNETGHEILIHDYNDNIDLNYTDLFIYDENSITTGKITYLPNENIIDLKIKAWDNANNPNSKEVTIYAQDNTKLKINNAYNFPNPFSNSTDFTFEINQNCEVKIDIFSLGGRRIKSIIKQNLSPGYHSIKWNGLDQFDGEIANGVYLYRIKAEGNNSTSTLIERCAKYR